MRIGKLIAAFVGITMVIGSLGLVVAGTFMVAATDDVDGFISAGPVRVRTDAAAVVGEDIDLFLDEPVRGSAFLGLENIETRLAVNSRNDKRLFVGIGPARDVDHFLAGASYSVVEIDSTGDHVVLDDFAGSSSVERPADQDFWVASTLDDVLNWDLESGLWTFVVMNQDGTAGIDTSITAAARVPFLRPIGAAILVAGLLGLVAGGALVYFGVRSDRQPVIVSPPQPPLEPAPVA